jgi:hypothetical protein
MECRGEVALAAASDDKGTEQKLGDREHLGAPAFPTSASDLLCTSANPNLVQNRPPPQTNPKPQYYANDELEVAELDETGLTLQLFIRFKNKPMRMRHSVRCSSDDLHKAVAWHVLRPTAEFCLKGTHDAMLIHTRRKSFQRTAPNPNTIRQTTRHQTEHPSWRASFVTSLPSQTSAPNLHSGSTSPGTKACS